MNKNKLALVLITFAFAGCAFAAKPPVGSPDPNAVSSYKQTVYQGDGADTLLILMQTVGLDPSLTVHKASDGTLVGPFITQGATIHWTYYSTASTPSGSAYPTPPSRFIVHRPATGPTAQSVSNPTPGETVVYTMQVGKVMYIYVFQYNFNFAKGVWEWQEIGYQEVQVNTSQK